MPNNNLKSLQDMKPDVYNQMQPQLNNLENMNNPNIQKNLMYNPMMASQQMNGFMPQMQQQMMQQQMMQQQMMPQQMMAQQMMPQQMMPQQMMPQQMMPQQMGGN